MIAAPSTAARTADSVLAASNTLVIPAPTLRVLQHLEAIEDFPASCLASGARAGCYESVSWIVDSLGFLYPYRMRIESGGRRL
jgi:hypothetical protein